MSVVGAQRTLALADQFRLDVLGPLSRAKTLIIAGNGCKVLQSAAYFGPGCDPQWDHVCACLPAEHVR